MEFFGIEYFEIHGDELDELREWMEYLEDMESEPFAEFEAEREAERK